MTHTSTEQLELLPCPFCGGKAYFEIDDDRWQWVECGSCGMQGNRGASLMEDCKPKLAEAWNRRAPAAPVPQGWKLVPVELLDRATESLGSFVSDHGWGQADMDTFDDLSALSAAPQPPEAAPVQMPEPVAVAFRFETEENGPTETSFYPSDRICIGMGWTALYTEHQVLSILAQHGIKTK